LDLFPVDRLLLFLPENLEDLVDPLVLFPVDRLLLFLLENLEDLVDLLDLLNQLDPEVLLIQYFLLVQ
jgi:hypothetical protein